ncbi:MAG: hypothetical protein OXC79_01995 [Candidatus Poribacteria bacterium]|nr:hypothetical protein [Candidatus Poribacteria bacterium]
MKLLTTFSICICVGLIGLPTAGTAFEFEKYLHIAKGGVVSTGRGLTVTNDELETALTEEFSIGFQLTPALRFSVPFGSSIVDTRGSSADVLPFGMLNIETVGMMLTLSGRGKWAPFIGLGTNFYDFTEQFAAPANIQNTFGAEASTGLSVRLIDSIFEVAQLNGSFGYQFSFLRPKVSVPARPDVDVLSLNRHSITFRLELLGL